MLFGCLVVSWVFLADQVDSLWPNLTTPKLAEVELAEVEIQNLPKSTLAEVEFARIKAQAPTLRRVWEICECRLQFIYARLLSLPLLILIDLLEVFLLRAGGRERFHVGTVGGTRDRQARTVDGWLPSLPVIPLFLS